MKDPAHYFDHAATTRVAPVVRAEMAPFLDLEFGNANSLHAWGREASRAVDLARQRVAELAGLDSPEQVVFTAGATEANNWILRTHPDAAASPFEHSSVWETAQALGLSFLPNDGYRLEAHPETCSLMAVMVVNNETGAVLEVPTPSPGAECLVHRDITQAFGKLDVRGIPYDFASCSAHKLGGPKGVGALLFRDVPPDPWVTGGEQESGLRAGTLNVPGIVGFGAACALAVDRLDARRAHAERLNSTLLENLDGLEGVRLNGAEVNSLFIVSVSFLGVEGETLVIEADARGFAISSGAACSSRSTEPSHVLTALGLPPDVVRGTIRVSFGDDNTPEAVVGLALCLRESVERLRNLRN